MTARPAVRETKNESYLHREVEIAGGTTRKFTGRMHNTGRIVIWPTVSQWHSNVHFVECKAPGKKARPGQVREHARLRKLGCKVLVLDTIEKVNHYVRENKL